MNKKYFETKSGSLEEISTKIATEQPTITKEEPKIKLERKTYFENKPGSLEDAAAKVVSEGKELKENCECKCGKTPCKSCGKDHHIVKEETMLEFTTQQIKQAYGILNDPRYKQGNYDGAVKAIEKLAKGLSKHKDVANALKRANESVIKENPLMALGRTAAAAAGAAAGTTAVNRAADAIGASVDPKAKKENNIHNKKSFEKLRNETKLVRLGDKGKTATGQKAAVIDLEPRAIPV